MEDMVKFTSRIEKGQLSASQLLHNEASTYVKHHRDKCYQSTKLLCFVASKTLHLGATVKKGLLGQILVIFRHYYSFELIPAIVS